MNALRLCIAIGYGSIWVTVPDTVTLLRIDLLIGLRLTTASLVG